MFNCLTIKGNYNWMLLGTEVALVKMCMEVTKKEYFGGENEMDNHYWLNCSEDSVEGDVGWKIEYR